MAPINRGFWLSAALTVIGTFFVAQYYVHDLKVFWAVLTGVVLVPGGQPDHRAVHLDRTGPGPRDRRVGPDRAGHHGAVGHLHRPRVARSGPSSPSPSPSPWPSALGGGNIEHSFYLVALIGIGLLATTGMVVSEDSFGPVSDNAAGVAEMSGEFTGEARADHGEPRRRGQHHQGHHQGGGHRLGGDRRRGPVRLVHRDHGRAAPPPLADPRGRAGYDVNWLFHASATQINVANPDDLHRPADRRLGGLPLLLPGHPGGRPLGGHGGPGGAPPVPRAPRDHGLHREARVRPGHLDLHGRRPAGAGHPGPAGHPDPGHRGLRHRLPGPGGPSWPRPS